MSRYACNSAGGRSYQHNGNVIGNPTINYFSAETTSDFHKSSDADSYYIPPPESVSPIDARFDGDIRAVIVWLRENNLQISKDTHTEDDTLITKISSYSVYRTFARLATRRLEGTAEWIEHATEFREWLRSTGNAELYLVGKVGSGKTTIMTSMMEQALDIGRLQSPVLSYFFIDPASTMLDLFSSLTQQLLRHLIALGRPLPSKIRLAMQRIYCKGGPKPTLHELRSEIFQPLIQEFPRCIILIDGINDSEPGGAAIAELSKYFRGIKQLCQLQILISAQNLFDLPAGATTLLLDYPSGHSRNDSDIRHYVETELAPFAEEEELLGDPGLYVQVRDELLEKAHGMFLWVSLQINYLFGEAGICRTPADVRSNLGEFPAGLTEIYQRCLSRTARQYPDHTSKILSFASAAPEPMHVDNLRELLAFDVPTRQLNEDNIQSRSFIRRAASILIVFEASDATGDESSGQQNYLVLAHSSVRDFVFSSAAYTTLQKSSDGHTSEVVTWTLQQACLQLGELCVAYLLTYSGREVSRKQDLIVSSDLPTGPLFAGVYAKTLSPWAGNILAHASNKIFPTSSSYSLPTRPLTKAEIVRVRLLDYARRNWHRCLHGIRKDSLEYANFKTLVFEAVDPTVQPWYISKWHTERVRTEALVVWSLQHDHGPLLDLAIDYARQGKLLSKDFWIDPIPGLGYTSPMYFAVHRCKSHILARLLPLGQSKPGPRERSSLLHEGVKRGDKDIVELLLRYREGEHAPYRLPLTFKDANGRLPLHLAAMYGHATICEALVCSLSEAELLDVGKCTPLYFAIVSGSNEIIQALVRTGTLAKTDLTVPGTLSADSSSEGHAVIGSSALLALAMAIKADDQAILFILRARQEDLTNPSHMDELYEWASTDPTTRIPGLQESCSKFRDFGSTFECSDGLNFAGRAVQRRSPDTLVALGLVDKSFFETSVGSNYFDLKTRDTPWTPIQLAAKLGFPDVVDACLEFSSEHSRWQAMLTAAIHFHEQVFELLQSRSSRTQQNDASDHIRQLGPIKLTVSAVVELIVTVNSDWGAIVFQNAEEAMISQVCCMPEQDGTETDEKVSPYEELFGKRFISCRRPDMAGISVKPYVRKITLSVTLDKPIKVDIAHGSRSSEGYNGEGYVQVKAASGTTFLSTSWASRGSRCKESIINSRVVKAQAEDRLRAWNLRSWFLSFQGCQPSGSRGRLSWI